MNAEELFDVVDAFDNVTGVLPRREVHRRRLLHRAVHVFVFRGDGQMLVHRRADDKEEFPSVWTSSASGHVSAGEDYDQTAPRELMEELGISANVRRLHKFEACPDTSMEFTVLYSAVSDDAIRFDPVEIAEIRWIPLPALVEWLRSSPEDFSPAFRLLFAWYVTDQVS